MSTEKVFKRTFFSVDNIYMAEMLFWTNVNNLIKSQKTTQEALCKETNLSLNTLRGWVSKNVLPRADEAVRIAKSLNTTVEYLVTGEVSDTARELAELKAKVLEFAKSVQ